MRALFLEYAAQLEVDLAFEGFEQELKRLPGEYAPPRGALLLAELDGGAVGCAGLRPLGELDAEVKRVYVRSSARGRGVGGRLVEELLASAARLHYRRVRLDTLPSMTTALALYAKLGFREIPPYHGNGLPGTRYFEFELA